MPKLLPPRPNLEQLRKQAKDLLKSLKSGDPEAIKRIQENHPRWRSEEHTSELQSQSNLVCRLLLEKKNSPPTPRPLVNCAVHRSRCSQRMKIGAAFFGAVRIRKAARVVPVRLRLTAHESFRPSNE